MDQFYKKKKIKNKQERRSAACCNSRDDLLHLNFFLKISIFPTYNPVGAFIAKIVIR